MKKITSLFLILATVFIMTVPAFAVSVDDFSDVKESDWFYEYVNYAVDNGIIIGTSETTLSPYDSVTRGQFILTLYRHFVGDAGYNVVYTGKYIDVPSDESFTDAVYWVENFDVVTGATDTNFFPYQAITRQDATTILYGLAKAYGETELIPVTKKNPEVFTDYYRISSYAKDSVTYLQSIGVILGDGAGYFKPKDNMTRAEYIAMLTRYMKKANGESDDTVPVEEPAADILEVQANPIYIGDLESRLSKTVQRVSQNGEFSAYIQCLANDGVLSIGSKRMQSASLIMLFVAACAYENFETILENGYTESDMSGYIEAMLTAGDNNSANALVEMIGNGDTAVGREKVNQYCSAHGYYDTHMGRMLLESNEADDNYTSVADCGKFLSDIYNKEVRGATEIISFMLNQQKRSMLPSGVGDNTRVANKPGELTGVANDAAIVFLKDQPYIIAVMSQNLENKAAAKSAIKRISSATYNFMSGKIEEITNGLKRSDGRYATEEEFIEMLEDAYNSVDHFKYSLSYPANPYNPKSNYFCCASYVSYVFSNWIGLHEGYLSVVDDGGNIVNNNLLPVIPPNGYTYQTDRNPGVWLTNAHHVGAWYEFCNNTDGWSDVVDTSGKSIDEIEAEMPIGSILFFGYSLKSIPTAFGGGSHIAIYAGDDIIYHCGGSGVDKTSLSAMLNRWGSGGRTLVGYSAPEFMVGY